VKVDEQQGLRDPKDESLDDMAGFEYEESQFRYSLGVV
jgi:hypothetical protein